MKSSENKKQKRRTIKLFWKKSQRPTNDSAILVNGKTVVFIACSIISGFINLVFITNLTKSAYTIGTLLSVPAAILLGLMSIGLDLSKCLHAIQVNTLNELYRKLSDRPWAKKIKNVSRKWFTIYILYVILSIITSMSLSSISIGAGITRNANMLKQIDEQIATGEKYVNIDSTAENITMQNIVNGAVDTSEEDAKRFVQDQVENVWPYIEDYQAQRRAFTEVYGDEGISLDEKVKWEWKDSTNIENTEKEIVPTKYWDNLNATINQKLSSTKYSRSKLSGRSIYNLTLAEFESGIKRSYLNTTKNNSQAVNEEKLDDLSKKTVEKAYGWLETLNSISLVNPRTGKVLYVDIDRSKPSTVLVQKALTELKVLRVDVENDSGDIGPSSKIFMQLGSMIEGHKGSDTTDLSQAIQHTTKSSSFGTTEIMMMAMLLFLSLLCELAINQFSPKTAISRKMLSQFSQYFPAGFDINDFMLEVLLEQYNYGEISKAEFDKEVNDTLAMMKTTKEDLLSKLKKPSDKSPRKFKIEPTIVVDAQPKEIKNEKIDGLVDDIEKLIASEAS